jgi:hypothetical protein
MGAIITLKNTYKLKYGIKLDRTERRRAKIELDHFAKEVEPIVFEFEKRLFDEIRDMNYQPLYNEYLEKITKLCDFLNKVKYRVIAVDNYFFNETYKPLELV